VEDNAEELETGISNSDVTCSLTASLSQEVCFLILLIDHVFAQMYDSVLLQVS